MEKRGILKAVLITITLVLYSVAVQAQCAMCRSTLENNVSVGDVNISARLNLGIVYLFVTPYILFAVIAFLWYRTSKKNSKQLRRRLI